MRESTRSAHILCNEVVRKCCHQVCQCFGTHSATFSVGVPCCTFEAFLTRRCVQDLGRLGRSSMRTVLLDDTPLAFVRQPDNGIPVLSFRCGGQPSAHACRMLLESVFDGQTEAQH